MDLVSLTVGLPFAPVRGLLAVARTLQEEAEREMYDPESARRELEEIEAARAEGTVPDDVAGDEEQRVLDRLMRR